MEGAQKQTLPRPTKNAACSSAKHSPRLLKWYLLSSITKEEPWATEKSKGTKKRRPRMTKQRPANKHNSCPKADTRRDWGLCITWQRNKREREPLEPHEDQQQQSTAYSKKQYRDGSTWEVTIRSKDTSVQHTEWSRSWLQRSKELQVETTTQHQYR